jgi:hypothetical protein
VIGAAPIASWITLSIALAHAAPVHVEARADVPWSAVVLATPKGGAPTSCTDPAVAALLARGAQCTATSSSHGSLVTLEGPPELEAALLAALTKRDGVVLAELHQTPRTDPHLDAHDVMPALSHGAPASGAFAMRLAPSATLWGLEGALLVLVLEEALKDLMPLPAGGARVTLDAEGARLWIHAPSADEETLRGVRAALDKVAMRPPAPQVADKLWQRARGQLAARDATVGARARARGLAWLACGTSVIEDAADGDAQLLFARVRSRVLSAALVKAAAAQASASLPAPATR